MRSARVPRDAGRDLGEKYGLTPPSRRVVPQEIPVRLDAEAGAVGDRGAAPVARDLFLDVQRMGEQVVAKPVLGRAACKTLIDSERRKNTQASNDVRARQLVRF